MSARLIVGIGGTGRPGSSTELLVAATLEACRARGAHVALFDGAALLGLPHYQPPHHARTAAETHFVKTLRQASGVVVASPSYHGGVSALVKNALDLLEDTAGDARPYFAGLPVGLIVSSAGWQAAGTTLSALRDIVHALRGWPTPLGVCVNTIVQHVTMANGRIEDADIHNSLNMLAEQVMAGTSG